MNLKRARVVRGAVDAARLPIARASEAMARRVAHADLASRQLAAARVQEAEAQAQALLEAAKVEAAALRAQASAEAAAEQEARFAAQFLALAAREDEALRARTEQLSQLAVLLAERLLDAQLQAHPETVRQLAANAIAEARGSGQITVEAHPEDAASLRELGELPNARAMIVRESPTLGRGSLLIHTELGTLDARLRPQLDRLAAHLRALLRE